MGYSSTQLPNLVRCSAILLPCSQVGYFLLFLRSEILQYILPVAKWAVPLPSPVNQVSYPNTSAPRNIFPVPKTFDLYFYVDVSLNPTVFNSQEIALWYSKRIWLNIRWASRIRWAVKKSWRFLGISNTVVHEIEYTTIHWSYFSVEWNTYKWYLYQISYK